MTAHPQEWIIDNEAWPAAAARLSVLIPYLQDDPRRLLSALDAEKVEGVEIVLLDDGGEDDEVATAIDRAVQAMALPVRQVRLARNEGRSRGRNRLARHDFAVEEHPDLRGRELVAAVGARRTAARREHDIADPYRRGESAAATAADTMSRMLGVIVPRLAAGGSGG